MKNLPNTSANFPNLLRKLVAIVSTIVLLGLALMFSVIVITVILVAGAIAWAYLWWKTRELRKQMRNYPPRGAMRESDVFEGEVMRGQVIEGEVIRVDDSRDGK
jgi:uncharacterized protein YneF (UPF0154 family)